MKIIMDATSVNVDVEYTGDVTVQGLPNMLRMSCSVSWEDFEVLVAQSFDCEKVLIKYFDEDNDLITISSEEELRSAMEFSVKNSNSLVIRVCPLPVGKDNAVSEAPQKQSETNTDSNKVNGAVNHEETGERTCLIASANIAPLAESTGDRSSSSEEIIMPKKKNRSHYTRMMRDSHGHPAQFDRLRGRPMIYKPHVGFTRTQPEIAFDAESGEKSPDLDPKPPVWFVHHMEKFSSQISHEVSNKVTRKVVRQILKGLEGAVVHTFPGTNVEEPVSNEVCSATQQSNKEVVYCHTGIVCDCCEQTIVGIRFKCANCEDYDLCAQCENIESIHDQDHTFLKIRRPALMAGRKKGRMVPILKYSLYMPGPINGERENLKEAKKLERMQEKEAKRKLKKEEKLKRRCYDMRQLPVKKEKIDISQKKSLDAKFVCDETFQDGAILHPGTKFMKKWLMCNTGLCVWDESVKLCVLWGTLPPQNPEVGVPCLQPGEEGVIAVELVAPEKSGLYQNHWRLQRNGFSFGDRIWCNINVSEREPLEATTSPCLEIIKTQNEECDNNEENGECEPKYRHRDIALSPCKELLSFEMLDLNDSSKIKVAKASQTATPNNTPLDLSPPKSPEPELVDHLSNSSSVELVSDTHIESDSAITSALVQERMATLGLRPDIDVLSITSCSDDSDVSDNDFFIVPLPDCFNTSLPLARSDTATGSQANTVSDTASEKSIDEMLTTSGNLTMLPLQPDSAFEKENSCETSGTSEQTADTVVSCEMQITDFENDVKDSDISGQMECETGEERGQRIPEVQDDDENGPQCPASKIRIEVVNADTEEIVHEVPSQQTEPDAETGQDEASAHPNPEFANLMSTALGVASMAATQAFHTAKDVFNTLQGKNSGWSSQQNTWQQHQTKWTPADGREWTPTTVQWSPQQKWTPPTSSISPMDQLTEMGFCNRDLNRRLLEKFEDDVEKTVGELLQHMDNDWHKARH